MPNTYQFTATNKKPVTKTAKKGAADPLYFLSLALSHITTPLENSEQMEKDLKRYGVVVDGVSRKGKDQLELFNASPALYGLHHGVAADAVKLMMQNFTLNGVKDTIVPYGLLQKGHYKKQGEVYSYETSIPVYTLTQMIELGEKMSELSVQESKTVDVNKLVPFACTMKCIATVDLSNKDDPVTTFQLTVESDNPGFKYQGPKSIQEVQIKEISEKLLRKGNDSNKENKSVQEKAIGLPKESAVKQTLLHAFKSGAAIDAFTTSPKHKNTKIAKSPESPPPQTPRNG